MTAAARALRGSLRPARIEPLGVRACTATGAFGQGLAALEAALDANRSALVPNDRQEANLDTWIGRVALPREGPDWPDRWSAWDSRATRLAALALRADGFTPAVAAAVQRHGAARVGVVIGTSAATIAVSEAAYRSLAADGGFPAAVRVPALNTPHAVTQFVQLALGIDGPALTVSTACSSGAQAFAVAERWLRLGLADAVVAGGVDALGASLLHGFHALQVLSAEPCRPFDAQRRGISIGEAAAFVLLDRESAALRLGGYGISNDAHHMSSPHPQGLGAELALDDALARAGIDAAAVDLVNLHGTGTAANDAVEAALVARRYADTVHAHATKGLTGHTMGAAGALEAVICLIALERGLLPGSVGCERPDPAFEDTAVAAGIASGFAERLCLTPERRAALVAASHSFGFGGNNAVLIFDRQDG